MAPLTIYNVSILPRGWVKLMKFQGRMPSIFRYFWHKLILGFAHPGYPRSNTPIRVNVITAQGTFWVTKITRVKLRLIMSKIFAVQFLLNVNSVIDLMTKILGSSTARASMPNDWMSYKDYLLILYILNQKLLYFFIQN